MDFNIKNYLKVLEDHLEFERKEIVYHKTCKECGPGIILTYKIYGDTGDVQYLVSFAPGNDIWCYTELLTKTKPIDY